ncbi:hypothetical protein BKA65DRAFT_391027, partial [Rhexocercosporidium sp. MPI-PUGE-AT-0058]
PNNRESITFLKCVSTKGKSIESFLIIKEEVMAEKLFNNSISNNIILIATLTGFTNDINIYR